MAELQRATGVSRRAVEKYMTELRQRGVKIVAVLAGKKTVYEVMK
jgi:biotin operon repressor